MNLSLTAQALTGAHTPTPWKTVSTVNFNSGLTYVSVQPVEPDPDTMGPLRMMSGEYHVCRMSHTAARRRIDMYKANADFIVKAVNSHDDLVAALQRTLSWLTSYPGGGAMGTYKQAKAALEKAGVAL